MNTYQFNTNINCSGCVAKVTPLLDAIEDIKWNVDTDNPQKVLTVNVKEQVSPQVIIQAIKSAGFTIEPR